MEKKRFYFYLFFLGLLAYEAFNVPLLNLEIEHKTGSLQYQILFQCMFGSLIVGLIGALELYFLAKRQCDDTLIYNHTRQDSKEEKCLKESRNTFEDS